MDYDIRIVFQIPVHIDFQERKQPYLAGILHLPFELGYHLPDAQKIVLDIVVFPVVIFRQHNVEFALQFICKSGIEYNIVYVYADTVRVDVGLSCKTYRRKQYRRKIALVKLIFLIPSNKTNRKICDIYARLVNRASPTLFYILQRLYRRRRRIVCEYLAGLRQLAFIFGDVLPLILQYLFKTGVSQSTALVFAVKLWIKSLEYVSVCQLLDHRVKTRRNYLDSIRLVVLKIYKIVALACVKQQLR